MKDVPVKALVVQPAYPIYRNKFFELLAGSEIEFEFVKVSGFGPQLKEYEVSNKNFFVESLSMLSFSDLFSALNKVKSAEVLVVYGNFKDWKIWPFLIVSKILTKKIVIWTQFRRAARRAKMIRLHLALLRMADSVYCYTRSEAIALSRMELDRPTVGLGNGVDYDLIRDCRMARTKSITPTFFCIGRNTSKAKMNILIQMFADLPRFFTLDVVGVDPSEFVDLPSNVKLHGLIANESDIAKIAYNANFFIYAGAVGLSLIHAMSYGLIPFLDKKIEYHMPEIDAVFEDTDVPRAVFLEEWSASELQRILRNISASEFSSISDSCQQIVRKEFNCRVMSARFVVGLLKVVGARQ